MKFSRDSTRNEDDEATRTSISVRVSLVQSSNLIASVSRRRILRETLITQFAVDSATKRRVIIAQQHDVTAYVNHPSSDARSHEAYRLLHFLPWYLLFSEMTSRGISLIRPEIKHRVSRHIIRFFASLDDQSSFFLFSGYFATQRFENICEHL